MVGEFPWVPPVVMVVVTAALRKTSPLAHFPVLVTLDYCSLSMTQQITGMCTGASGQVLVPSAVFAGTEELELILPLNCDFFFLKRA